MCCALTTGVDVDFSETIVYAAETLHSEINRIVHVLGYQNTVQNNVKNNQNISSATEKQSNVFSSFFDLFRAKPRFGKGLGNAMLLPFPAKPCTMSRKNVIETEDFPDILTDISYATMKQTPSLNPEPIQATLSFSSSKPVEVFEAAGIYTVVLAQNVKDIPDALSQVPIKKRPNPNPEIFEAYSKWYPDWTFALCCFNNEDKKEAHPLLWWYEPMFEDKLFLPALDAHDGSVPNLDNQVRVDHTLAVGSNLSEETTFEFCYNYRCIESWKKLGYIGLSTTTDFSNYSPPRYDVLPNAKNLKACPVCGQSLNRKGGEKSTYQKVDYRKFGNIPNHTKNFLMEQVIGRKVWGDMSNGDFFCEIKEVREGVFNPIRRPPVV